MYARKATMLNAQLLHDSFSPRAHYTGSMCLIYYQQGAVGFAGISECLQRR